MDNYALRTFIWYLSLTIFFTKKRSTIGCQSRSNVTLFSRLPTWGSNCFGAEPRLVATSCNRSDSWLVRVELVIYSTAAAKLKSMTLVCGCRIVAAVAWSTNSFRESQIPAAIVMVATNRITGLLVAYLITILLSYIVSKVERFVNRIPNDIFATTSWIPLAMRKRRRVQRDFLGSVRVRPDILVMTLTRTCV